MNIEPSAVPANTSGASPSPVTSTPKQRNTTDPTQSYWLERKRYLAHLKQVPELRAKFARELTIYLLRRLLWSFTFFPVFIAFWVPFVLAQFNPVLMVSNLLPGLEAFVQADPEAQATTLEGLVLAWFSVGIIFAVFDLVLTPFKSPYELEADVHMRAWEQQIINGSLPHSTVSVQSDGAKSDSAQSGRDHSDNSQSDSDQADGVSHFPKNCDRDNK